MSKCYQESGLCFEFDEDLEVIKYDEIGGSYREQLLRCFNGLKAVDFICKRQSELWLLEIKNYAEHDRTKSGSVVDEFLEKVRDTFTGITTLCLISNRKDKRHYLSLLKAKHIHLVLHCDFKKQMKTRDLLTKQRTLQEQLRKKLRFIDSHVKVTCIQNPAKRLPWSTSVL